MSALPEQKTQQQQQQQQQHQQQNDNNDIYRWRPFKKIRGRWRYIKPSPPTPSLPQSKTTTEWKQFSHGRYRSISRSKPSKQQHKKKQHRKKPQPPVASKQQNSDWKKIGGKLNGNDSKISKLPSPAQSKPRKKVVTFGKTYITEYYVYSD